MTIYTGSVLDITPELIEGGKYHALLCDPPYELGFMGKKWDSSGIAFDPATWERFGEFMYPGAFGLAFAGSRGWHRMAIAIEDAGFRIHPTIFCWVFGQGFAKGTRIDDQIDKLAGVEQRVVGKMGQWARNGLEETRALGGSWQSEPDLTAPVTEEAIAFAGHRYGLQALKPAVEPIIMFQKPYEGKPVENMIETGAGGLNMVRTRVGDRVVSTRGRSSAAGHLEGRAIGSNWSGIVDESERVGGLAANFTITHGPDCIKSRCVCGAREMEEARRDLFYQSHFHYEVYEQLDGAMRAYYTAKAGERERDAGLDDLPLQLRRNALTTHNGTGDYRGVDKKPLAKGRNPHPTVKPIALTKWLATLLLPPDLYAPRSILVPFSGVGSEMIGAQLAGWERIDGIEMGEEYVDISSRRLEWWGTVSRQLRSTDIERIARYTMRRVVERDVSPLNDLPLFANHIETDSNEE